jgi:8-oxo-dGTP pyrophosphatase MutT (NUDIX family)
MMHDLHWKLIKSETVVCDQWLTIECNTYLSPLGPVDHYYVVRRKPFVVIVADYEGSVVLIHQYRPATDRFYWALPAGYIDDEEPIISAAVRELREETGLEAKEAEIVGCFDPLPGYVDSRGHVVRCRVHAIPTTPPDKEVAEVALEPWLVVRKMIEDGAITEMQAITALLLAFSRQPQTLPSLNARP